MKINKFLVIGTVAVLASGCVKVPTTLVAGNENGLKQPLSYKEGTACSILGLGDNSIAKAAKNAGIKNVVSSTVANYFGIVVCTNVQGVQNVQSKSVQGK